MKPIAAFLILSRPHFLAGAALLYAVGAAAAVGAGATISWDLYLMGQAMVTSIQLVTHYSNEFFDVASDRATEHRTWLTGGSGVLVDGRLSEGVALRAALISAVVAGGLIVWIYLVEPVAALIGMMALLAGWFYSAPPLRLEASGFGELTATLVVAGAVPATAALLQYQAVPAAAWWAIGGLAPLQFAMMLSFSLPDWETDRDTGKLVLVARIGPEAGRRLLSAAVGGGLAVLAVGALTGALPGLVIPMLVPAIVAGATQVVAARRHPGVVLVTAAAGTLLLAAAALLLAFVQDAQNPTV